PSKFLLYRIHVVTVEVGRVDLYNHHVAIAGTAFLPTLFAHYRAVLADHAVCRICERASISTTTADAVLFITAVRMSTVIAVIYIGLLLPCLGEVAVVKVTAAVGQPIQRHQNDHLIFAHFQVSFLGATARLKIWLDDRVRVVSPVRSSA